MLSQKKLNYTCQFYLLKIEHRKIFFYDLNKNCCNSKMSTLKLLMLIVSILVRSYDGQQISEDLLNHYKPLDSFVELKGGDFFMGVNDHNGVNYEYPPRWAKVHPFR